MAITASMVKELRERTGAGMMECKKALLATDGDLDAAIENLRATGQAKADKKAGRVAADGQIVILQDGDKVVIVEVNSETDFVAKDENFIAFGQAVATAALGGNVTDVAGLGAVTLADGRSVEEARTELVSKVGENISLRRFSLLEGAAPVGFYTHGARIGSIVALEGGDDDLARDIAMHVAAMNPACIDESGVDSETLERERRIFSEQAEASGKPVEIIEKMVAGKLRKFLQEITLVGQPFVKDSDQTVGQLLQSSGATVASFIRYEVGEGIEKKVENFAAEVMQQIADANKGEESD